MASRLSEITVTSGRPTNFVPHLQLRCLAVVNFSLSLKRKKKRATDTSNELKCVSVCSCHSRYPPRSLQEKRVDACSPCCSSPITLLLQPMMGEAFKKKCCNSGHIDHKSENSRNKLPLSPDSGTRPTNNDMSEPPYKTPLRVGILVMRNRAHEVLMVLASSEKDLPSHAPEKVTRSKSTTSS